MEVYNNTMKIGIYQKVPMEALEPVLLAALFHDTGYAFRFQGHEEVSAIYAKLFMEKHGYDEGALKKVTDCIRATRMPQDPQNNLETIICDADLFHLGTYAFQAKNNALRKEWSKFLDTEYADTEWLSLNIDFLQQHQFHTEYGKEILEPIKQENLKTLYIQL